MSTDRPAFAAYNEALLQAIDRHRDNLAVFHLEMKRLEEAKHSHDDLVVLYSDLLHKTHAKREEINSDATLRAAFDAAVKESIRANKTNLDAMLGL